MKFHNHHNYHSYHRIRTSPLKHHHWHLLGLQGPLTQELRKNLGLAAASWGFATAVGPIGAAILIHSDPIFSKHLVVEATTWLMETVLSWKTWQW